MSGTVLAALATSRRSTCTTSRCVHIPTPNTRLIPRHSCRSYSQQTHQTPSGERDRSAVGVFTPKTAALFVATGVGLFFYFRYEKEKLMEQRQKELEDKEVGRPHVGGSFSLTTHENKPFTQRDLLGKWSLIYFGFTNCPDICPEELDKMSAAVETLEKHYGPVVQPIFISVDPARDSVSQIARYVSDFHPRLIGLTGDYAAVKATCKAYRVYFSTPKDAKATDDYLVDHSIFFYFMDPNGQFVDAFGKASTVEDVVARVQKEIGKWQEAIGNNV
ncbi:SCO1 protein [Amylocystis lapponica]|nr:SCO1 protein [Amylocystis lapponica]